MSWVAAAEVPDEADKLDLHVGYSILPKVYPSFGKLPFVEGQKRPLLSRLHSGGSMALSSPSMRSP